MRGVQQISLNPAIVVMAVLTLSNAMSVRADEVDDGPGVNRTAIHANAGPARLTGIDASGDPENATDTPAAADDAATPAGDAKSVLIRDSSKSIVRRGNRSSQSGSSAASGLIEMLGPLCVVLLVVGGLAYAAKRWMPRTMQGSGGPVMKVLARQTLSPKQSLCLVRVGRRMIVMGVTPGQITALSEITDAEEVSMIASLAESSRPSSFSTLFSKASAEIPAADEAVDPEIARASDDPLVHSGELARAQERVQSLLSRVRALSQGVPSPAEPARGTSMTR